MTPYYQDEAVCIYHGDCREVLPFLPKTDLLLTDPPYGISAAKRKAHSSIRDDSAWPEQAWDDERQPDALVASMKLVKHSMIWGGNYYTDVLSPSSGWLAWVKPEAGTGFSLADMELCWTSYQFAARVKHCARRDGHLHPTQKPEALMVWCLSFADGCNVLDPFMGSGTTLVAAKRLCRKAIGIERERKYCDLAIERLAQGALALEVTA
jgi:DNA modification methylase